MANMPVSLVVLIAVLKADVVSSNLNSDLVFEFLP